MCVTLVAACRRHDKSKSHKKSQNQTDGLCHGAILINDENDLPNHRHDRCFSDDDPDPDIIPNIQGKAITNALYYLHIKVLSTNSRPTSVLSCIYTYYQKNKKCIHYTVLTREH